MTDINVLTICGSLRKASFNRMLVNTLPELAPDGMSFTDAPGFGELPLFDGDLMEASGMPEGATRLAEAVGAADGVIIVSPEYNYSVPGGLKNAIDWVSRMPDQPFKGKPVALQSVSPSPLGGSRAQYHMRQIMVFLEASMFNKPEVFVAFANDRFDKEAGRLTDETSRKFVSDQLTAFGDFIRARG